MGRELQRRAEWRSAGGACVCGDEAVGERRWQVSIGGVGVGDDTADELGAMREGDIRGVSGDVVGRVGVGS